MKGLTINSNSLAVVTTGVLFLLVLGQYVTPYMTAATATFLVLCSGILYRKINRKFHAQLMSLGILVDLALVLILEFQRGAIETASGFSLSFIQQTHVISSTLAVTLYLPTLTLGIRRLKGWSTKTSTRTWHIRLGGTAFLFRTIGFFTMFSMLDQVK
jgi:hypothetical protein